MHSIIDDFKFMMTAFMVDVNIRSMKFYELKRNSLLKNTKKCMTHLTTKHLK